MKHSSHDRVSRAGAWTLSAGSLLCVLIPACASERSAQPAETARTPTTPPAAAPVAVAAPAQEPPAAAPNAGMEKRLSDALAWLAKHQSPNGAWDSDNYMQQCGNGGAPCTGGGEAPHDAGVSGLALLAFLGAGNTPTEGPYMETVARGVAWLRGQQDPKTGLIGERIGHAVHYNHALATLALCEASAKSKDPELRESAERAVGFIVRARNPYAGWRYEYPPTGENDTSVTGWMVMALRSAEEAGLKIDPQAYPAAIAWLDEVTDPATGRTGYDSMGSKSSRMTSINAHYPPEKGETMTALALVCRYIAGQDPNKSPIMVKQASLLRAKPPLYDYDGLGNDYGYWFVGTLAMVQMGGTEYWPPWDASLRKEVVQRQCTEGEAKGSWDPQDAWGHAGGRIYTTALATLCTEMAYRYPPIVGTK